MRQRLTIASRFLLAVLAIAALFTVAGAEPARHLPLPLAGLFWVLSVGVGLALAAAAAAWLARGPLARRWSRWPLIGLAGMIGLLLYSGLSLGLEALFPAMAPDGADDDWLDRLEASGTVGALVAELLQAGPLYLLTWALLNVAPGSQMLAPVAVSIAAPAAPAAPMAPAAAPVPPEPAAIFQPMPPCAAPKLPGAPLQDDAESLGPSATLSAPAPPSMPALLPPAAQALGWPAALGDEVLCVTADLHYLHVVTVLGRATVLGSLAAVELHFGEQGLRIHRSHWVARRAIRRVARGAGGWRCELHDGQRLPISRRRVPEVRALLGSDFVLDQS